MLTSARTRRCGSWVTNSLTTAVMTAATLTVTAAPAQAATTSVTRAAWWP